MNENKTNINWLITINLNPYEKYCKIGKTQNIILHILYKNVLKYTIIRKKAIFN